VPRGGRRSRNRLQWRLAANAPPCSLVSSAPMQRSAARHRHPSLLGGCAPPGRGPASLQPAQPRGRRVRPHRSRSAAWVPGPSRGGQPTRGAGGRQLRPARHGLAHRDGVLISQRAALACCARGRGGPQIAGRGCMLRLAASPRRRPPLLTSTRDGKIKRMKPLSAAHARLNLVPPLLASCDTLNERSPTDRGGAAAPDV